MSVVVKLGGSYAFSPLLRPWLHVIAGMAGSAILVPGGGPFADAVREAQPRMGFGDAAAHDMAVLAMAQYGRAVSSLLPGFVLAETGAEMEHALAGRLVPVWSPARMLRDAADVPASWDVTSDSLTLWLAARVQAEAVVLVKHDLPPGLDAAFQAFRARYSGRVFIAGPDDLPRAPLQPGALPGRQHALA